METAANRNESTGRVCKRCRKPLRTTGWTEYCAHCRRVPNHGNKPFRARDGGDARPYPGERRSDHAPARIKPCDFIEKRRCHDCGKPTWNYRCDKCWAALRRKSGINPEKLDSYVEGCE